MVKVILILLTFNLSFAHAKWDKVETLWGKKDLKSREKLVFELVREHLYFSAAEAAIKYFKAGGENRPLMERTLSLLIKKVGVESFYDLYGKKISFTNSPTLSFAFGVMNFQTGKQGKALQLFQSIPKDHKLASESLYYQMAILSLEGEEDHALELKEQCQKVVTSAKASKKSKKAKRYYLMLEEYCHLTEARTLFKKGEYESSVKAYDLIGKRSYNWPHSLLEKAWANYYLKDFNRVLGLLVTYQAPLLESYFFPEAEVLNALAYFDLCLWEDALKVIERFYAVYKPRTEKLKGILDSKKNDHGFFIDMALNLGKEFSNPFLRSLTVQIRKQVKFSISITNLKRARKELDQLEGLDESKVTKVLISQMKDNIEIKRRLLNRYIKSRMYAFVNQVNQHSYDLFNIKLQILSKKKALLYKNKKLVSDRGRGDLSNVNRSSEQLFWDFKGAFWADEMGDYSFGLQSNCEERKLKREELI